MAKNIIQLHQRIKFWLDVTRTPRFTLKMIDDAINVAIDGIIRDRFVPSISTKDGNNIDIKGFQRTNMIREELKSLVKILPITQNADLININGTEPILKISDISNAFTGLTITNDYAYYTMFEIILDNGMILYPTEIMQQYVDVMVKDPFLRPTIERADQTYFMENSEGFRFFFGSMGNVKVSKVNMYYLAKPDQVFSGFNTKLMNVVSPKTAICIQETAVVKDTGGNNINVKIGDLIPYYAGNSANQTLVTFDYFTLTLPDVLFDEVAKVAALHLVSIVERTTQKIQ